MPRDENCTPAGIESRWAALSQKSAVKEQLADPRTVDSAASYRRNIENFIGTVKVPVGLAGPLRVNGTFANGDYHLPLATTEAALVASYSRGAALISTAGGCSAVLLDEGVGRAPVFGFDTLAEAAEFAFWTTKRIDELRRVVEATTRHGKFSDLRVAVEGNRVYLILQLLPGDASGQNMVTIAADAMCRYLMENAPVTPRFQLIEGNFSGDKKASALAFLSVRGKKVSAEAILPAALVRKFLKVSPEEMAQAGRALSVGSVMSGTIGVHGHYANGLAALYIACGQDAACVAESAMGITRLELTDDGDLYAAVTLPNLIVGTVGGGTGLPSQRACLDIMGLAGSGKARAFAEVCAGAALAGELSITGAIAAGQFVSAHRRLARGMTHA